MYLPKTYTSFIQRINCNVLYLPKIYTSFIQRIHCNVLYLPKVYASFKQSINPFIKGHLFDDTYIVLKVIRPPSQPKEETSMTKPSLNQQTIGRKPLLNGVVSFHCPKTAVMKQGHDETATKKVKSL